MKVQEINVINARVAAEARGVQVLETSSADSPEHGASIIIRTVAPDGSSRSVHGALIRRLQYEPRIIGIDDFVTEAVPSGAMLIVKNRDVPGIVAGVSGALAASGINIAQMNLSRDSRGGNAMSILNLDTHCDQTVIDAIAELNGVVDIKQIILEI